MNHSRIGIIGSGQLGLYLCEAAATLGLETTVLATETDSPAAFRADNVIVSSTMTRESVEQLIEQSDCIGFEKEDIPNEVLYQLLQAKRQGRTQVFPDPETLFMLKDKGMQKTWLQNNDFPTLPGQLLSHGRHAREMTDAIGFPLVQKLRCGGYDGRGVQVVNSAAELGKLWLEPSVLEPKLQDFTELAVIGMRDQRGNIECYPAMGMEFDHALNTLSQVVVPAEIADDLAQRATDIVTRVLDQMQDVGVFAFEFFHTSDDALLINEISPRVHNSGHLTMDANTVSQYEQHVRALAGLELARVGRLQPAAMVNVLYDDSLSSACPYRPVSYMDQELTAVIHWYGKAPGRQGRKMGHITATGKSVAEAIHNANKARDVLPGNASECAA